MRFIPWSVFVVLSCVVASCAPAAHPGADVNALEKTPDQQIWRIQLQQGNKFDYVFAIRPLDDLVTAYLKAPAGAHQLAGENKTLVRKIDATEISYQLKQENNLALVYLDIWVGSKVMTTNEIKGSYQYRVCRFNVSPQFHDLKNSIKFEGESRFETDVTVRGFPLSSSTDPRCVLTRQ